MKWNTEIQEYMCKYCYVSPEDKTCRTGVAGWETTKYKMGPSKLVPWRLKGGDGNKTHSRPLILSI